MPTAATTPTENKHRKVIVSPQTDEDKGMDGYAYVSGTTVKFRFGQPTSLRGNIIDFLRDVKVASRVHEEYTDLDKKRKVRVVKKEVSRYKVFELGKDFKLGEDFEGYEFDEDEGINSPEAP